MKKIITIVAIVIGAFGYLAAGSSAKDSVTKSVHTRDAQIEMMSK